MKNESFDRVGVYDSRSIALVYAGSKEFKDTLVSMRQDQVRAKEAGNRQMERFLEKKGRKLQKKMQRQAFGTYPVNDILELYKYQINEFIVREKISSIVSVWDKEALKKYNTEKQHNVTEQLIDIINPDEQQRKYAIEIQNKNPVSKFTLFFMSLF